jgi:hypothetical protein
MSDYIIKIVNDQCDVVLGTGIGATIGLLVALALTVCLR